MKYAVLLLSLFMFSNSYAGKIDSPEELVEAITKSIRKEKSDKIVDLLLTSEDFDADDNQKEFLDKQKEEFSKIVESIFGKIKEREIDNGSLTLSDHRYFIEKDFQEFGEGVIELSLTQGESEIIVSISVIQVNNEWYISNSMANGTMQGIVCDCMEKSEEFQQSIATAEALGQDDEIDRINEEFDKVKDRCDRLVSGLEQEEIIALIENCDGSYSMPPISVRFPGDYDVCTCSDLIEELINGATEDELMKTQGDALTFCSEKFESGTEQERQVLYQQIDACRVARGLEPLGLGDATPETDSEDE